MCDIRLSQIEYKELELGHIFTNTYIPIFQRLEDEEHTKTIYEKLNEYYSKYKEILLFGIISLGKIPKADKYIVFDGQHRIGALKKLAEEHKTDREILHRHKIRIDFYNLNSDDEALQIYNIINTNKKTDLFKGNIEPYILPSIQRYFKEVWPVFCKGSKKPRIPNINLDMLVKYLQGHNVVEKLNITRPEQLYDRIRQLNEFYSNQPNSKFIEWGIKGISNMRKICDNQGGTKFYLGLFKHYEWIQRLLEEKNFESQDHRVNESVVKEERKAIPKQIRREVWDNYFEGNMKGNCYCCERELDFEREYECGHVIAAKNGGENTVENLRVVCKTCNLDMSTMNMNDYKKLFTT